MQLTIKLSTINLSITQKFIYMTIKTIMSVSSCHVTYTFQSESTLSSCLNVRELLAQGRRKIWYLSDCNWIRTQNHLVRKRTLNRLAKWLSVCLQTKWFWLRVQLQLLKTIMQPFLHYLKINSPPNKVVQTKNLVHCLIEASVFFNNNLKSKPLSKQLVFLYDIFLEKLFISYYNFILLEC